MVPNIFLHADLPFPKSLPQFQRMFPDDAACTTYLERIRWENGFVCPCCGQAGEPSFSTQTLPETDTSAGNVNVAPSCMSHWKAVGVWLLFGF